VCCLTSYAIWSRSLFQFPRSSNYQSCRVSEMLAEWPCATLAMHGQFGRLSCSGSLISTPNEQHCFDKLCWPDIGKGAGLPHNSKRNVDELSNLLKWGVCATVITLRTNGGQWKGGSKSGKTLLSQRAAFIISKTSSIFRALAACAGSLRHSTFTRD
jgi:hypothetical protein